MPSCEHSSRSTESFVNLILLERDEIDQRGHAVLVDRRARHICRVLGAKPGDRVRVGAIRGPIGSGEIVARHGDDKVELRVTLVEGHDDAPVVAPSVDLVLAMPRPKALARVLRSASCLGVRRIDLVNAWRVDKSYLSSHLLDPEALRENLLLGCEQGGSTWVPEIRVHSMLMPFVRGELGDRVARDSVQFFVAQPDAAVTLEEAFARAPRRWASDSRSTCVAAIGPERGWIERELTSFAEMGASPVTLCGPILSVDIAVVAFLSQLALLRRVQERDNATHN